MKSRHGHRTGGVTPTYSVWTSMIKRCTNPKTRSFDRYGGRGIKVCERWKKFENFLADMGERPKKGLSLDRINNDGHYEPGNCRWATLKEQARTSCRVLEFAGQSKTVAEWAVEFGISSSALSHRFARHGVEKSLRMGNLKAAKP
jgi:hypothetical protein